MEHEDHTFTGYFIQGTQVVPQSSAHSLNMVSRRSSREKATSAVDI